MPLELRVDFVIDICVNENTIVHCTEGTISNCYKWLRIQINILELNYCAVDVVKVEIFFYYEKNVQCTMSFQHKILFLPNI